MFLSSLSGFIFDTVNAVTASPGNFIDTWGCCFSLGTTPRMCLPSPNEKCPHFSSSCIPTPLTLPEFVTLVNYHLVPILCYA